MIDGSSLYDSIENKRGERALLPIKSIIFSEFNTRTASIDWNHVDVLAQRIKEEGFNANRAVCVNVFRDAAGNVLSRRLVAGLHRYLGAKKAELQDIPSIIYYELTEEEECLLDSWDNRMDEVHKPFNFLQEAEHCEFLRKVKGWSVKKIAKLKNTNRALVVNKLKIAGLSQEAKAIIKIGNQSGEIFQERYFRDICKLQHGEHIVLICKEILERGVQVTENQKEENEKVLDPMKKAEIKKRVFELIEGEKNIEDSSAKINKNNHNSSVTRVIQPGNDNDNLAEELSTNSYTLEECYPGNTPQECSENSLKSLPELPQRSFGEKENSERVISNNTKNTDRELQSKDTNLDFPFDELDETNIHVLDEHIETNYSQEEIDEVKKQARESLGISEEKKEEASYQTFEKWTTNDLPFNIFPRWAGRSKIIKRSLTKTQWQILRVLLTYGLRFHKKEKADLESFFFYLEEIQYSVKETCEVIAEEGYLRAVTVQRNIGILEKKEYVKIRRATYPPFMSFQINWDKFAQIYNEEKEQIPFRAGGLQGLPMEFKGNIQATPLHALFIEDGKTTDLLSRKGIQLFNQLKIIPGISSRTAINLLGKYPEERIEKALEKYVQAFMEYVNKGESLKNKAGLFLKILEKA